jgi:sulfide:quinone oxidoreductase
LTFPVVPDADGELFRQLTTGWVPCSILVGPDGKVLFWESEFDEAGFSSAIEKIYTGSAEPQPEPADTEKPARHAGASEAAAIVVLGGGAGGLVAANNLRRRLPKEHRIVVIDRSSDHLFSSSLLWVMVGNRREEQIRRPLRRLANKGIEFHHAEVEEIDLDRRLVRAGLERFNFDYLIISLGAQLAPETVPGFDEMAFNLYEPGGCGRAYEALETFGGGTVGVFMPSMPFKCPAAPYEAAMLVEAFVRKKGLRNRTEIHLFTPEHQPMPMAGPEMGDALAEMLCVRGIHLHLLYTFEELRPETREIVSSDGRAEQVDILLGVPPHQAPEVVRSSGLLGVSGWIHVDPETLRAENDRVWAIGDITSIRLPNGKMLPKAGVFAHYEANVVVDQIVSEIRGRKSDAAFDGKGSCWVELGDGKAAFASGRFYADPDPEVRMFRPGRFWHWGKVAFEKWWLRHWF